MAGEAEELHAARTYAAEVDGAEHLVAVGQVADGWRVSVDGGEVMTADFVTRVQCCISLLLDLRSL